MWRMAPYVERNTLHMNVKKPVCFIFNIYVTFMLRYVAIITDINVK